MATRYIVELIACCKPTCRRLASWRVCDDHTSELVDDKWYCKRHANQLAGSLNSRLVENPEIQSG